MPSYKVIAPGFHGGMFYSPIGKRNVLHTDKPFSKKSIPSWLIPLPKESATVKAKREAQETSQKQTNEQKMAHDLNQVNLASTVGGGQETSFLGDVENAPGSTVETL